MARISCPWQDRLLGAVPCPGGNDGGIQDSFYGHSHGVKVCVLQFQDSVITGAIATLEDVYGTEGGEAV